MANFRVGSRVRLLPHSKYIDQAPNGLKGTITDIHATDFLDNWCHVKWDDKTEDGYHYAGPQIDLQLVGAQYNPNIKRTEIPPYNLDLEKALFINNYIKDRDNKVEIEELIELLYMEWGYILTEEEIQMLLNDVYELLTKNKIKVDFE